MNDAAGLAAIVAAMSEPGFYPQRPSRVEVVQTHISYVFIAGEDVYKLKKAVRFAFLDFSTLEKRRHFCHEEVRLNRRLAGDTYLGVLAIRQRGSGFEFLAADAAGAVEYAVHMRRLPADRMLTHLLERDQVDHDLIDRIAARLQTFHAATDAGPEISRGGDPSVIAGLLADDFGEVDAFHGDTIDAADDDAIRRFCRDFLHRHDADLRRRQAEGRIRDGHGDLHAEHVCCTDPLVIFDCIEFNPSFRHRDVAAEIAFLAMDLVFHHRRDLADRLVQRYAQLAGDDGLGRLVPFYACQRAYIRGKVDSLKSVEPEVGESERKAAHESAVAHFALAYRYTWAYTPRLVVVVGLSGSGKSVLAAALHERTGFAHINSDATRKRLAGLPATARPGQSLYTPERNAATYAAIYDAGRAELAAGRGAIIDATFQRRAHRDAARAVARQAGVQVRFVECICPVDEVRRRLEKRRIADRDASDADWEVYLKQVANYEAFAPDEESEHVAIDTTTPLANQVACAERSLRRS